MTDLTTPVGRIVHGNPSTRYDITDDNNNPKLNPDGTKQTQISFGLAIAKQGEQHWSQTPWGQTIWNAGAAGWGDMIQRQDFAWKITDGDSNVPNRRGNKPCDKEGYQGHWVINFSTRLDVKLYDYIQSQGNQILEAGVIKTGHYAQVFCTIEPNNKTNPNVQSAGVYINPVYVAHSGYGTEIQSAGSGPALNEVGFGQNVQLPAGASTVPQNGFQQPPANQQQPMQQQPMQQHQPAQQQQPMQQHQPAQQQQQQQQPMGNSPAQNTANGYPSNPAGYGQPNTQFANGPQGQ